MKIIDKIETLRKELAYITERYCGECQEFHCDWCIKEIKEE